MAGFKSSDMEKEFKELIEKIIPSLNKCNNCNIEKCRFCLKFSSNCSACRLGKCKNCEMYKRTKEILMRNCCDEAWEYIANFLTDFFKISDSTTEFFNLPLINKIVKEKNNIFLTEKELTKHIEYVKRYNKFDHKKIYYFVRGRKYWLSGPFFH